MKFEQVIVNSEINFFKKDFMEKWGLKEFHDKNKPLIFFGFRNLEKIYEDHNSYKIVIPSVPNDIPDFQNLKNNDKTILVLDEDTVDNFYIPDNVIKRKEIIEFKNYELFKPNTLGDKIYYYSLFQGLENHYKKNLIDEIQKNIDFEIITTKHINLNDYYDIKYLKQNYYDKCFLNLNFTEYNGMTTVKELGLMGRKTITIRNNKTYDFKSMIYCNNLEEVLFKIKEESIKVGTIQPSINNHTVGEEWLYVDFWKKN